MILLILSSCLSFAGVEICEPPNSSWISVACYNDGVMRVVLRDRQYYYCGVPYSVFQEFVNVPSAGSYYNEYIKGRYRCW